MALNLWKNSFEIDIAVISSETFSDPLTHVEAFARIRQEEPGYWDSVNQQLADDSLGVKETNIRLHNIFMSVLVQKRRTQIADLYRTVSFAPSDEVIRLLSEMNELDGIDRETKYNIQTDILMCS